MAFNGASLVMMLKDAPLTVEQVEQRTRKRPNEKSGTETIETIIYRNDVGKFRIEVKAPHPLSEMVTIADPVEGFIALLAPPAKIAYRMMPPKTDHPLGLGFAWPGLQMSGKSRKSEDIGNLRIEGIEFEGIRTTVTSDNGPAVIIVDERWISRELGLIGRVDSTSPNEHYSARIKRVVRKDLDQALFVIPTDYAIRDIEEGREYPRNE